MWWRIFWGSNSGDQIQAGSRDLQGGVYSPGVFAMGYLGTRILARGGNDYIRDVGEEDTVWGGAGNDIVECHRSSSSGEARGSSPIVYGEKGNDILSSDGDGRLFGGYGNDTLTCGGSGHTGSRMSGGPGNDLLRITGHGYSGLYGGPGKDTFEIIAWSGILDYGEEFSLSVKVDFKPGVDTLRIQNVFISDGTLGKWVESGRIESISQTKEGVSAVFEDGETPFQITFLNMKVDEFMLL